MAIQNYSVVTEFILLGLSDDPRTQFILFLVFFIIYLISLLGNVLIIIITVTASNLQTPMYFFLANLSFLDICYSSTVVPRMLKDMLSTTKTISYAECVMQMYIVLSLGECECILLAIIAYDRYIAICYPLHYTTIISRSVCIRTATGTYICGFILSYASVEFTWNVGVCGSNKINHFQCEVPEILALGCGNIIMIELLIFVVGVIVLMIPIAFIIVSYFKIILAVLKITSSAGQRKALSTCGSHILVVTLFYGSAMATYMKPRSQSSPNTDKMFAILYTVVTPMLNPLIYTLRNKEVKAALKMIIYKNIVFNKL
ncbi:olfactory receptor 1019-like [Spea bombifrons]|uniref:olfactory receptor 1019-like n=1 Tax=Spea bombifrons TaxID=233779 RepID=UPI002348F3E6|nr:olfactory receptor 1019-like [Spea bombifrons]